ncbi:MAG: FAD-dependent oxidoreductase, partial [Gammaproteobacteria bacterium]|nr:FAD-dependent oxidoreductase [Gammaproteobacteria bacterium]
PQWQKGMSLYMQEREARPSVYQDETAYAGAHRITGGSYRLIEALLQDLPSSSLHLKHQLLELENKTDYIRLRFDVEGDVVEINAKRVVLTIPPRVLAQHVRFTPELDQKLITLMQNTPTWMASHAKAVIRYQKAFWHDSNLSGNGFAIYPGAVLREIFDACSPNQDQAAISGFFALPADLRQEYRHDLDALLLEQLVRLVGKDAATPEEIIYQDWYQEPYTATAYDFTPPLSHPQYGHQWFQLDHWNDKLHFAGTETAKSFGGYLEGALESAKRVAKTLLTG